MRFTLNRLFLVLLLAAASAVHAQEEQSGNSDLSGELLYQLLLGELSMHQEEPGKAYALLLDAARKTGDARLYQRAVEVALQARSGPLALQATREWSKARPEDREAYRQELQILIALGQIDQTSGPLRRMIALTDPSERNVQIATLSIYFSRSGDKARAARALEQGLAGYLNAAPTGAAAWSAVGRLRLAAGDAKGALAAAERGQSFDARAEGPALLALALMSAQEPEVRQAAQVLVDRHLERQPDSGARLIYARILIDAQRYAEARMQVEAITKLQPSQTEAWFILGTLEQHAKHWNSAERAFKRFLELAQMQARDGEEDEDEPSRAMAQAWLALAQIAQQRKDYAQAEAWLARIRNPEDLVRAQSLRAGLLAKQGRMNEARELIRGLPERDEDDARSKFMAEVQLLRDNKQYAEAYTLLSEAVKRDPDDYDLLYDQAMMAEKIGRPGEMEQILRRIIAGKPEFHHAYNALGYFLADRNMRLGEARALILKALEYAPDDPYITDSLGWVAFRAGDKKEALRVLQKAYKTLPDAEIAAHLGEVLWSMGRRGEARTIWREGLQLNAENETLLETLKRLRVEQP